MKAINLEEIKQWAIDDFACGKIFDSDDFNEFCHILKDDHPGLKISNEDFEKYWDCYWDTIEECQSRSDEDEDEDYDDFDESMSVKAQNDTDKYDKRAVEKEYGLEDGELDAFSIREAEDMIGCEEGELEENNDDNDLNESVSKDAQEVVNPTYAKALKDLEETDKKKEDALEVPEHNQGPKEVKVKATPEMKKLHLDESLFDESISNEINNWNLQHRSYNPRENEEKIYYLIDNGVLDWETVGEAALLWMSEDDLADLASHYGWFDAYEDEEDDELNEDASTKLSSDGRQRPTSYTKKTFRKPLSLQVYDALTDLGYDVFGGIGNYAFTISKHYEKNLQRAKDYLDSKNIQYKVDNFNNKRFELKIILPNEDDKVDNYFKNVDYKEKRAVNEDLILTSGFSTYKPWSGAVDTYSRIEDEGKLDELEAILEDMYPNGISMTALNDLLWMEKDYVLNLLGIRDDEDDELNESFKKRINKIK